MGSMAEWSLVSPEQQQPYCFSCSFTPGIIIIGAKMNNAILSMLVQFLSLHSGLEISHQHWEIHGLFAISFKSPLLLTVIEKLAAVVC